MQYAAIAGATDIAARFATWRWILSGYHGTFGTGIAYSSLLPLSRSKLPQKDIALYDCGRINMLDWCSYGNG